MFILDTGLFVTLVYKDRDFTDNEIYMKLLNDKQHTDLGYVYENMVAQMTAVKGDALYYYTFPSTTSNHNYEIDFLLTRHNKLCPVDGKVQALLFCAEKVTKTGYFYIICMYNQ